MPIFNSGNSTINLHQADCLPQWTSEHFPSTGDTERDVPVWCRG